MSQAFRGATWGKGWINPYEAPFTLAHKYAWANASLPNEIAQLFAQTKMSNSSHSQSMLIAGQEGQWRDRFLSNWTRDWTRLLATDEQFRYCPECIRFGYQAAVFQLSALADCPIHRCALQTTCHSCGSQLSKYLLTVESFERPMHCRTCGAPWSASENVLAWHTSWEFREQCEIVLAPLHHWLAGVSSSAVIQEGFAVAGICSQSIFPEGILGYETCKTNEEYFQVAAFHLAAKLIPSPLHVESIKPLISNFRIISIEEKEGKLNSTEDELLTDLKGLYKCVRRQIQRRHFSARRRLLHEALNSFVEKRPRSSADSHGEIPLESIFIDWRRQYEQEIYGDNSPISQLSRMIFFTRAFEKFSERYFSRRQLGFAANLFMGSFYRAYFLRDRMHSFSALATWFQREGSATWCLKWTQQSTTTVRNIHVLTVAPTVLKLAASC